MTHARRWLALAIAGLLLLGTALWLAPQPRGRVRAAVRHEHRASTADERRATSQAEPGTPASHGANERVAIAGEEERDAAAALDCVVVDLVTGGPIAGALVRWECGSQPCGDVATTDASGHLADALVPATRARVSHPNYLERNVEWSAAVSPLRKLGLYPRTSLRLRVVDALGAPVEGAAVELSCDAPHLPSGERERMELHVFAGMTDRDGVCTRANLPGGQRIQLLVDGEPHSARLSASAAVTELRVELSPRAELRGRYVHADGDGAAELSVRLVRRGAEDRFTLTDAGGAFRFERVPLGVAKLVVDWPCAPVEHVSLEQIGALDLGTRVLAAHARVAGRVVVPVPELSPTAFTVRAWRAGRVIATARPARDGSFEFDAPAGDATLELGIGEQRATVVALPVHVPEPNALLVVTSDVRALCFRTRASDWSAGAVAAIYRAGAKHGDAEIQRWADVGPLDGLLVLPTDALEAVDVVLRTRSSGGAYARSQMPRPLTEALAEAPWLELGFGSVAVEGLASASSAIERVAIASDFGSDIERRVPRASNALIERVPPGPCLALLGTSVAPTCFAQPIDVAVGTTTTLDARALRACSLSGHFRALALADARLEAVLSWIDGLGYWRAPIGAAGEFSFPLLPAGRFALAIGARCTEYVDLRMGEALHVECAQPAEVEVIVRRRGDALGAIADAQLLLLDPADASRQRVWDAAVLAGGARLRLPEISSTAVLRVAHLEGGVLRADYAIVEPGALVAGGALEICSARIELDTSAADDIGPPGLLFEGIGAAHGLDRLRWAASARRTATGWIYEGLPPDSRFVPANAVAARAVADLRGADGLVIAAAR